MTQEPGGGQDQDHSAGAQLARLLRRWWEEAGSPAGGSRPTQQALAVRLDIDQTTLSRYLNPRHLSTAPLRVVEALHTQLRAPAAELEQARALCRAALLQNGRRRSSEGGGERTAPAGARDGSDERPAAEAASGQEESDAGRPDTTAAHGTGDRSASGRSRGSRWLRPSLVAAAVVLSFTLGMVVHERLSPHGHGAAADGAAGAAAASKAPYEWPLLRMGEEDQFTRARALQHLLNAHGYKVQADGFFRQDTRDAVMDFQKRHDLPADGKAGRQTWPVVVKEVGPGSGAFEVRAVQELLNNVGQGGTPVSGEFTAATAEDLRFFQRTHGLPVTGRANADTWLALLVKQHPPVKAPAYQRPSGPLPSASM
ncbi:peptidoglycan-binding protein [Streptomyces sp. BR123]|uniref:peptidoglycan-binding protein n=1 Tax=Streptomyces sp. BR123 TaxID=2749828 RepID=UPI0015C43604|nr:peptidoglycan-binding protein [Streptomyces sp. BR123]NXY99539.1 peptidoglycan-binding protein [Streptomyces sp. BR123]